MNPHPVARQALESERGRRRSLRTLDLRTNSEARREPAGAMKTRSFARSHCGLWTETTVRGGRGTRPAQYAMRGPRARIG
jgi:hypothetical protein